MNIDKNKFRKTLFEKFHIVIYSSDSNKVTKNFHFSRSFLILIGFVIISIYTFILIGFFLWTPLNSIFSRGTTETKRVNALEQKVRKISDELLRIQEYNSHLRYALGDTSVNQGALKPINNPDSTQFRENFSSIPENKTGKSERSSAENDLLLVQPFSSPVNNYIISQKFDEENNHLGLDFAGKMSEPIIAAADGYVVFSNWTLDYGNTILIMHGTKFITKYKHNSVNLKPVGSYVRRGEIIALLGNSGKLSSSPHLHFEIWKNGIAVDPFKFLMIKN